MRAPPLPSSIVHRSLWWALALPALLALTAGCAGDASPDGPGSDGAQAAETWDGLPACADLQDPEPGTCFFATSGFFTSKAPYNPHQSPDAYEAVPEGFTVVSIQHVARHGSRTLSSADDDDLMAQVWAAARDEGALTPLGQRLGPVLDEVIRVHTEVGYGRTTRLGEVEHEEMAGRMVRRHRPFLQALAAQGARIDVYHSGRTRAAESGDAFVRGMVREMPELEGLVEAGQASEATLYFSAAEGSEAFQAYRAGDPRMLAAVATIEEDPRTREMARLMLRQLFSDDFVQRLADGALVFSAAADPSDRIEDELDAAEALFGLYGIAPALSEEADLDFGRFVHPDAAAWFGYVDDAGSFYNRGPGFADEDISFAGARVLVADMLQRAEEVVRGEASHPVTLRFSHSQALVPLAAWLGIEGAYEGVAPDELYTYETNPWRSELVAPMGANVQWEVLRNQEGITLVRMLHHEAPIPFAEACRPWREGSFFYELDEVRRCLGL
ncbi:MAG: histidine-type phosphatase [Gemmatimonadales bacterium]|nr:MAG: histidine-type phosphatase [Gemmatimonadales bacterium]